MSQDAAYQAALDYLYSFVDYSLTHQQNLRPELFNLDRMQELVASLGDPQKAYPTIHVAGTKGKGSVCAFCAAGLQAGGYKVGLYTSPHLKDYEERIQINGQAISPEELVALTDEIKPHVAAIPRLTTFEITTALAFWYFARQGVDIAVIEVGLGGRLDATNVITPLVSVITSLSLDHTYVLGNTLGEIAAEKGGIIKAGVPIVIAPQRDEPRKVLQRIAEERGAPLVQVGLDYKFAGKEHSLEKQVFSIWRANHDGMVLMQSHLLGNYQIENAATAYAALQQAREHGIALSEGAIQAGFKEAAWPGRFEILRRNPPVVIDSAHNDYSARALSNALDEYFPEMPILLIFGVSEDKDILGILKPLLARTELVITTQSGHPRAMEPQALADAIETTGVQAEARQTAHEALTYALELAGDNTLILAAGSVFIAASVRVAWFEIIESGAIDA